MDILSVMIQAIVAGHPNGWGLAITTIVSAAVCFISFLRFRDRERDRALLARLDIGEEAKKQIKETMDSAPGGKLLLAFLVAGTVLSGIVRDEVLYFSELRQIELGGQIAAAANKPGPEKPCIPRCAPGTECRNGKCSAVAAQPPPAPSSRLVNVPGVSPGDAPLFFAGSLFQ